MACDISTLARFTLPCALRRSFLLLSGTASSLSISWSCFLCEAIRSPNWPRTSACFLVSAGLPSSTSPKSTKLSSSSISALEQLGDLGNPQLNQSGPADGLLHPQFPALHAASEIDFALTGKQRYGAHFAQIHAYRVVGVNRLFGLLGRELLFLNFFGMEEISFFVERKSEGFVTFC